MHFPPFPYSMNLYITYFFYWHLYINHAAKEKKFMRFLWQKQGNCCSSLQHQTHSYHKLQVRPSQLKGVLLLLLLKTIILLILLIVYSWSLPNGSMSNSSSLSCEIWGSDTKKSPWMISFQKVPTHKILTGTRVIFHKDYFVNFELNWVQLLTPFNE